ncbi:cadherin-13-like [Pitangus sulphuratus]|nr:cadherin-13-like [Pitangus sulphuratus]
MGLVTIRGRMQVIRSEGTEGAKFRLSGKGVDQDPKGIFRISEVTGDVSVTRTLDREAIANYELEVEVTDLSGKTIDGPVRLDIAVIDQNDNRPMFKEGPYVGHVMEGSPTEKTRMSFKTPSTLDTRDKLIHVIS